MDVQWILITKKLRDVQMKTVHRERVQPQTLHYLIQGLLKRSFSLKIENSIFFLMQVIVRVFSLYRREWMVPCVISNNCNKSHIRNQRSIYVEINKCALPHVQWPNEISILLEFMGSITRVMWRMDSYLNIFCSVAAYVTNEGKHCKCEKAVFEKCQVSCS